MAGEWCFDPMGPVTHVLMKEEILDYAGRDYWKVTYQQRGYGVSCATIVAHDTQEAWEQARGIANFRIPGKVISVKRLPVKKMTVCVDLTPVHTFTGIFGFRGKNDLSLVTEVASESGKLKRNHAWLPLPEGLEHGQKIQFTGKWMEHLSGEEWVFGPELIELKTEGLSPPR
jgi:hypothetical protein